MGSQCYLAPGRGDIPALTPTEAGTLFSNPRGMHGWVDLVGWLHTEMVYPPKTVTHPSTNRARCGLTSFMRRTPLTTTPRRHVLVTHTHTRLTAFCPGDRYQNKHSPTHTHPDHRTSFIIFSVYNDPWHPLCSVYELEYDDNEALACDWLTSSEVPVVPLSTCSATSFIGVIVSAYNRQPLKNKPLNLFARKPYTVDLYSWSNKNVHFYFL